MEALSLSMPPSEPKKSPRTRNLEGNTKTGGGGVGESHSPDLSRAHYTLLLSPALHDYSPWLPFPTLQGGHFRYHSSGNTHLVWMNKLTYKSLVIDWRVPGPACLHFPSAEITGTATTLAFSMG